MVLKYGNAAEILEGNLSGNFTFLEILETLLIFACK